jgi:acyl-CoA thioester hydrolase
MRPPFRLSTPIQIRFRDTDAMVHVNNAVYLTYLEVARMAYWHHVFGVHSYNQIDFILARAEIDFLTPVFVHEQGDVWIRVSEIGRKSFRFAYEFVVGGRLAARAETVQVSYDYSTSSTKPLSDAQRQAILDFEETGSVRLRSA